VKRNPNGMKKKTKTNKKKSEYEWVYKLCLWYVKLLLAFGRAWVFLLEVIENWFVNKLKWK